MHNKLVVLGLALALIAVGGCSDAPSNTMNGLDMQGASFDIPTNFNLEIVGNGTVTLQNTSDNTHPPCTGDQGHEKVKSCGSMQYARGDVTAVATPADGWKLLGFFEDDRAMKEGNTQRITSGNQPPRITVKFAPQFNVNPINAVFNQPAQTTTYTAEIKNPGNLNLSVSWVGPNCGEHTPALPETKTWNGTTTMSWFHPHPNCDASTDHSNIRVGLVVVSPYQVWSCHYNGAHDGVGPACE